MSRPGAAAFAPRTSRPRSTRHTGSGDIEAALNGSGDVDIQTGSGGVHLRGVKGGLRARSGSGDISADGSVTGGWQLHTGSGSVQLGGRIRERIQSGRPHRLRVHPFRPADYGAGLVGQARAQGQRPRRRTGSGCLHRLRRCGNPLAACAVLQRIWPVDVLSSKGRGLQPHSLVRASCPLGAIIGGRSANRHRHVQHRPLTICVGYPASEKLRRYSYPPCTFVILTDPAFGLPYIWGISVCMSAMFLFASAE